MRFLQIKNTEAEKLTLTEDLVGPPGPYAILSHTWGADADEVTFEDVKGDAGQQKKGYDKLLFSANRAREDGLEYSWVDTCCIDRANHVELSEAITSMFRWYQKAEKCYVYLSDVSASTIKTENDRMSAFRDSRWFTRGWTLQELLAPPSVDFFSREGIMLGSKRELETLLHDVTSIPVMALQGRPLKEFSVDERMRWAQGRVTRKIEDRAYCLLGIFDVSMSLRYGEGEKALERLDNKVRGLTKGVIHSELAAWLAPSYSVDFHTRVSATRHPGTGSHFANGIFKNWLQNRFEPKPLLWITGKSGTGKTILFSHIVETVSESSTTPFAYHYCAFSDHSSQKLVNILGSFALQISKWQPAILRDVTELFQKDQARRQEKSMSVEQIEFILSKYVATLGPVIFLVDGLDESEDFDRTCASIFGMVRQLPNLKIMIASTRRVPSSMETMGLETEINSTQDIQAFVDFHLSSAGALNYLSSPTKAKIKTILVQQAEQSFRWVSLTLDNLKRQRTGKAVLNALTEIPSGLYSTYASMLDKIAAPDRAIAKQALLWMCFTLKPLNLLELSEAAILEETDTTVNQDSRLADPATILEICYGFIDFDTNTKQVKLAHSSVRNYLLSDEIRTQGDIFFSFDPGRGHRLLMRQCLTYLMFTDFDDGGAMKRKHFLDIEGEFPLFNYAASYWIFHAPWAEINEWHLADKFLSTRTHLNGGQYATWARHLHPSQNAADTQPLYYAASLGSESLVHALLSGALPKESKRVQIEEPGGRYGSTPLQVACFRRKESSARVLIKYGANFWSKDPGSQHASWWWAQVNGWEDLVKEMVRLRPVIARGLDLGDEEVESARIMQDIFASARRRYKHIGE